MISLNNDGQWKERIGIRFGSNNCPKSSHKTKLKHLFYYQSIGSISIFLLIRLDQNVLSLFKMSYRDLAWQSDILFTSGRDQFLKTDANPMPPHYPDHGIGCFIRFFCSVSVVFYSKKSEKPEKSK